MATIRLLQYNNYYNRIVKREDSINEYATHVCVDDQGNEAYWVGRTNFIMRDGVDTTYVANWHGSTPDYLLVTDDTDRTILSRWFVIEANYSAVGQYVLTLHRDLIVDYYNDVVNAKTYIEKATLDMSDPFIFNSENIEFNKIKSNEFLIQDDSSPKNLAWLVGYCAANAELGQISIPNYGEVDIIGSDNIPLKEFIDAGELVITDKQAYSVKLNIRIWLLDDTPSGGSNTTVGVNVQFYTNGNINVYSIKEAYSTDYIHIPINKSLYAAEWNNMSTAEKKTFFKNIITQYISVSNINFNNNVLWNSVTTKNKLITDSQYQEMLDQDGKIVQNGGTLEKIRVTSRFNIFTSDIFTSVPKGSETYVSIYNEFAKIPTISGGSISSTGENAIRMYVSTPKYYYEYKTTTATIGVTSSLNMTNRGHLSDQPFDMFAIAYPTSSVDTIKVYDSSAGTDFNIDRTIALNTAMEIMRSQGAKIYDVQLLPYCPMREIFSKSSSTGKPIIDVAKYTDRIAYIKNENNANVGLVIYPNLSKEKFSIKFNNYQLATSAVERKVKTLTKMFRLCSPGYNSIFEFNAEKNGGLSYFNVFVDFKPISPYIHLAPNFGGLYGANYEDMRGLTCEEDFSITKVEDAFVDFQLRNKNYQQIFNREIQNMEDTHQLQQMRGIYDTVIGAIGAGIVGGTSKMGGVATGIGAFGQKAISGGIALGFNEDAHRLEMGYKKDRFGYNLDNIKALPQTIGKITAFCINNKIFPVLEEYSATPEEEQALRDKLEYNGMSVHRIGSIAEFLTSKKQFIQGEIIRMENLVEDYHLSYSIALEINSGVYI